jgi:hypothetical protein
MIFAAALLAVLAPPLPSMAADNAFPTMQLNGTAVLNTRQQLQLVDNYVSAGSAFVAAPITITPTTHFVSTFTVKLHKLKTLPQADGFSFMVENDPAGDQALGGDGNCIGICGISNFAAIGFQSYSNDTVGLWYAPQGSNYTQQLQPMNLGYQTDALAVTVTYDQPTTTLSFTATNASTGEVESNFYTVDLSTLGSALYVGFTGGSGGAESRETITSWKFKLSN